MMSNNMENAMQTGRVTLDEDLLAEMDSLAQRLGVNRSAFTRQALHQALDRQAVGALAPRHRQECEYHPVKGDLRSVLPWMGKAECGDSAFGSLP